MVEVKTQQTYLNIFLMNIKQEEAFEDISVVSQVIIDFQM